MPSAAGPRCAAMACAGDGQHQPACGARLAQPACGAHHRRDGAHCQGTCVRCTRCARSQPSGGAAALFPPLLKLLKQCLHRSVGCGGNTSHHTACASASHIKAAAFRADSCALCVCMHVCAPQVGGLGDVVTGLAKACLARGHNVSVLLPFYESLPQEAIEGLKHEMDLEVPKGFRWDGEIRAGACACMGGAGA